MFRTAGNAIAHGLKSVKIVINHGKNVTFFSGGGGGGDIYVLRVYEYLFRVK